MSGAAPLAALQLGLPSQPARYPAVPQPAGVRSDLGGASEMVRSRPGLIVKENVEAYLISCKKTITFLEK